MGSGLKNIVFNQLERAVSSDFNRLQSINSSSLIQPWQWLIDAAVDEDQSAGVATVGTASTAPLRAHIFNGITVRPEIGTANLFIEPGLILIVDPDVIVNSDYVAAKQIFSDGVAVAGQLVLTPNTSGSTRFDVIECSRDASKIIETDNRDIYDNVSGTFNPSSVTKISTDGLTFRIRLGTPGNGFPGAVAGWLPLAVSRVSNNATNWNSCVLWDVRPLVSDLARSPNNVTDASTTRSKADMVLGVGDTTVLPEKLFANGIVELTYLNRKVGGRFPKANLLLIPYVEPGWIRVDSSPWYLYLMFPFGLPRWALYSPVSSGFRRPMALRGIPVFTQKQPADMNGYPASAINLPYSLGTSTLGIVAISGISNSVISPASGIITDNSLITDFGIPVASTSVTAPSSGLYFAFFDITPGTSYPVMAKRLRCSVFMDMNGVTGDILVIDAQVWHVDSPFTLLEFNVANANRTMVINNGGSTFDTWEIDIPVLNGYPDNLSPPIQHLAVRYAVTYSTNPPSTPTFSLTINGWTL